MTASELTDQIYELNNEIDLCEIAISIINGSPKSQFKFHIGCIPKSSDKYTQGMSMDLPISEELKKSINEMCINELTNRLSIAQDKLNRINSIIQNIKLDDIS